VASVEEHSTQKAKFYAIMLEHTKAARISRLLESGRFAVLADTVETMCLTNENTEFGKEKEAFTLLIYTMLNSASGRHAQFKSRSSLRYILEALIFYADLQSNLTDPQHHSRPTFGENFAGWFVEETSDEHDSD
jgi:hypothetical protein